jgi:CheY-like chemotaxis protein
MNAPRDPRAATVLVVDDEHGPREAFEIVLETRFNVLTAESGWAALELLKTTPVDVITLDLMMPTLSGVETLRRIREIDRDISVIVVSAMAPPSEVAECARLGATEVLTKPFARADILAAVDRAVKRAASFHGAKPVTSLGRSKPTGTA